MLACRSSRYVFTAWPWLHTRKRRVSTMAIPVLGRTAPRTLSRLGAMLAVELLHLLDVLDGAAPHGLTLQAGKKTQGRAVSRARCALRKSPTTARPNARTATTAAVAARTWWSAVGVTSSMRRVPVVDLPPACSMMKEMGLHSYTRRSLPLLFCADAPRAHTSRRSRSACAVAVPWRPRGRRRFRRTAACGGCRPPSSRCSGRSWAVAHARHVM